MNIRTHGRKRIEQLRISIRKLPLDPVSYDLSERGTFAVGGYGDFQIALLTSVKQNRPKYSEIFMDTPFGSGIARLVVDPFSYWIYTSAPDDNKLIETVMAEKGLTYEGAIEEILKREGSART